MRYKKPILVKMLNAEPPLTANFSPPPVEDDSNSKARLILKKNKRTVSKKI